MTKSCITHTWKVKIEISPRLSSALHPLCSRQVFSRLLCLRGAW